MRKWAVISRAPVLDFSASLPAEARNAIQAELASDPNSSRKIYAALAHKVWSLLVERRFDEEIRDWHDLVQGVKARVRESDAPSAERLTALGDLLRESISLALTSPAREVANRPRARQILEYLAKARGFVRRADLLAQLDIGSSHLSNVLTQLLAHALIERREAGKEAALRISGLGKQLIGADNVRDNDNRSAVKQTDALAARVQQVDLGRLHVGEDNELSKAIITDRVVMLATREHRVFLLCLQICLGAGI